VRPINRATPKLRPEHRKTYAILEPTAAATCEQVECGHRANGWQTLVDEATELGQRQAAYIRRSGRRFREVRGDAGLVRFVFEPGQRCFTPHSRPASDPLYVVDGGDHRGNPRGTPRLIHKDERAWVDDIGEHQNRLADRYQQG
jgi:hypothetical protein